MQAQTATARQMLVVSADIDDTTDGAMVLLTTCAGHAMQCGCQCQASPHLKECALAQSPAACYAGVSFVNTRMSCPGRDSQLPSLQLWYSPAHQHPPIRQSPFRSGTCTSPLFFRLCPEQTSCHLSVRGRLCTQLLLQGKQQGSSSNLMGRPSLARTR